MDYQKFLEAIAVNGFSEEDAKQGGLAFLSSLRDLKEGVKEIKSGEVPMGIMGGEFFYTGPGTSGTNNAIVILTNERIIKADKKITNTDITSFYIEDINSSQFNTSFLSSQVNISAISGRIAISKVKKDTGKKFNDLLHKLIREGKSAKKSGGALSGMDEIKKAKELLDAGIISQEEFEVVKKKHL